MRKQDWIELYFGSATIATALVVGYFYGATPAFAVFWTGMINHFGGMAVVECVPERNE